MRRDMDIVRDLLKLSAATSAPRVDAYSLASPSRSRELIAYHVRIMTQAGLVDSHVKPDDQPAPASCFIKSLTWEGNDFLDSVESDTVWSKVKAKLAENVGSASFDVIKAVAKSVLLTQLGLIM